MYAPDFILNALALALYPAFALVALITILPNAYSWPLIEVKVWSNV